MLRLFSESSRSYPGRSVRLAVAPCGSALYGNMQGDRAEVSRGHSRRRTSSRGSLMTGNEPEKGKSHPAEGLNMKKVSGPMNSERRRTRTGELYFGRVVE